MIFIIILLSDQVIKMEVKDMANDNFKHHFDESGKPMAILKSEGQQKGSDLQNSGAPSNTLVNALEGYVFICSRDYRIEYMNERLEERIGYNATGQICYKALQDRNSICPWCVNERVFQGETVRSELLKPNDNHRYYVVNTPIKKPDGSISKQSISLDITEFKSVLEHLKMGANQFKGLAKDHIAELLKVNMKFHQEVIRRKQAEEALRNKNQELVKRFKELNCLYGISKLLQWPDLTFGEILQGIVDLIPTACQFSDVACARITLKESEFATDNFRETDWKKSSDIFAFHERIGALEVYYLEEKPERYDGPFSKEEKSLINAISECLGGIAERNCSPARLSSSAKRFSFLTEREKKHLLNENMNLKSVIKNRSQLDNIVGKSPAMQEIYDFIIRASTSNANVVIEGESGTGKELIAQTIHKMSERRNKPFVPVNCGAIPEALFESEFFGHRKGAFTGAYLDKPGLFDRGAGGTIFLDEVGELSLNMQVKLLRAIEGKGYTPVGDNKVKQSDIRIIATSNRNLIDLVKKGVMRNDFFYRINIINIHIPPLRNRKEDIPLLIDDFLQLYNGSKTATSIPVEVMAALYNYDWPGNVRELQSVLVRYFTMNRLDFINPDLTNPTDRPDNRPAINSRPEDTKLRTAVENLEKTLILKALAQTNWNKSKAAMLLVISRRALFRKMEKLEMKPPDSTIFAHH